MYMRHKYKNDCGCPKCDMMIEDACDEIEDDIYVYGPKSHKDECSCGFEKEYNGLPENPILAQAYVPIQRMDKTFTPEVGLKMGTIFPELVRPYMPGQSMLEKEYIESVNIIRGGCNNDAYR